MMKIPLPFDRAWNLAFVLLFGSALGSSQVLVPSTFNSTGQIQTIDGSLWFGANHNLFRLSSTDQTPLQIPDVAGYFSSITRLGDQLWIASGHHLYRANLDGSHIMPIAGLNAPDEATPYISRPVNSSDGIWFSVQLYLKSNGKSFTSDQLYRLPAESTTAKPIGYPVRGAISNIVPVGDRVRLHALVENEGKLVYRTQWMNSDGKPTSNPEGISGTTSGVVSADGFAIVSTDIGYYRVDAGARSASRISGVSGRLSGAYASGNNTLIVTDRGAFRVPPGMTEATMICSTDCKDATPFSVGENAIWLATDSGVFRMSKGDWKPQRVGGDSDHAVAMEAAGGTVTFVTLKGDVFQAAEVGGGARRVAGGTFGGIPKIITKGRDVWVYGQVEALLVHANGEMGLKVNGQKIGLIDDMVPFGKNIWIKTQEGIFWIDSATSVSVDISGAANLFGTRVWIEGVHAIVIRTPGTPDLKEAHPLPASILCQSKRKDLETKQDHSNDWQNAAAENPPQLGLEPGPFQYYCLVKDEWGNVYPPSEIKGWVTPRWATLTAVVPLLGVSCCLFCLILAPYVLYCHRLLMNPFLRNWASFGAVPLLLTTVPLLRRHIFRRYLRTMAHDEKFKALAAKYVVPEDHFEPAKFGETLAKERVIALHGQSGIGKSAFLSSFAYRCASGSAEQRFPLRLTPVFLDLSIVGDQTPAAVVRAELHKHGDLTDEKLADALLDYGGFLFLFDGLNEVSEAAQKAIVQFVDVRRNHNCACVSTQIVTDELRRISSLVSVAPLSEDKIRYLVRMEAKDWKTGRLRFDPDILLEGFTPVTFSISRVPFQLELVIEIWEASKKIPKDLDDVYSFALGSVVDRQRWAERGHGDYPDILCELAFKMLTGKRPYDPKTDYLPDEVKSELAARKLLVDRGNVLEFRHDRVRAYLAAHYLAPRWRALLSAETTLIDQNWDAMLEFYLAIEKSADAAKGMMFLLARKDIDASVRLNHWGRENRPELFASWQDEFSKEIGRRVLGVELSDN
jgi:hypothetical protein